MTHSGGEPHNVGDKGQRYEVTFFNPETIERQIFGWSDTEDGAAQMVKSIQAHPSWYNAEVRDRHTPP